MIRVRKPRKGVTLVELLVAIVMLAVIGAAATRLLVAQAKFFDKQGAAKAARNVSRASLNRIANDLRMIDAEGGVAALASDSITVRVPFVFGLVCGTNSGKTTVSLMPVDSVAYASGPVGGFAWRGTNGTYNYTTSGVSVVGADASQCTGANITTVTNGQMIGLQPAMAAGAVAGTPMFRYRLVTYKFASSGMVSGKTGLYRKVDGGSSEEVAGPFTSDSHFRFFTLNNSTSESAVPATLANVRGIELHLYGESENKPVGQTTAEQAKFVTAIFFRNRMS